MPDISTIKLPNDNNTYYIKDSTARSGLAGKADASHTHTKSEITDFPSNVVTGTGSDGYLVKWNGTNSVTNGPQLGSSTATFLRNDGTWATPEGTGIDTWRNMTVNGSSWKGTGTSTGAANFKAGSNVTLSASGNDLTISATLPSGGMEFKGIASSESVIKAKTNQTAGSIWLASDTHEEWLCTNDIGSTASPLSWEKLGGAYGDLAYADTASASYTPAGTITEGTGGSAPVSVSMYSITGVGSLPSWTASVSNEILTIGWSAGSLPTRGSAQSVLTSIGTLTFTGTQSTITVEPDEADSTT